MPKGKTEVSFRHKGEKVTITANVAGRPKGGETAAEARERRITEAKTQYKAEAKALAIAAV